ncbi:hypothetical protein ONS95_012081 [Cadophora gregata]|uniref:uncharacterized protein n=1 Tax=Cadophora gregata TaxID=51156 RepID=UPI0026DD85D5|nr:uncharacterized protein ONS95_012081 [Cadophora gregata]KAK0117755.1 hypothetical protein ONS95_012081 [Cadophora gregata]KAK0122804.1 hypothetical protein ONS96_009838 [Cadophora gregata f. sp. sojae]
MYFLKSHSLAFKYLLLLAFTFLITLNTTLAAPADDIQSSQVETKSFEVDNEIVGLNITSMIAAREDQTKSDLACLPVPGQSAWRAVETRYIRDGIAHLQRVTNPCWVEGHACSRISCSYKSAITLCNVTPQRKGLSCAYMASYAQDILKRCTYEVGLMRLVGGQAWDTDGYNVNVYRDTSC